MFSREALEIFMNTVFFNNTVRAYLLTIGIVLLFVVGGKLYTKILSGRLRKLALKTDSQLDDLLIDLLDRAATPVLLALGLNMLPILLILPKIISKTANFIFIVIVVYYAISSIVKIIDSFLLKSHYSGKILDPTARSAIHLISKIVLWVIGVLLIVRNLGFDITSALAGMGIAGVAVALAIQNVLSDIFSYLSILIDKPFERGDFIIVGNDLGTVEHIGLRSTRLCSLNGQEIVISNADLTSSRINNFKRMEKRRSAFSIGVVYNTPIEKMRAIPEWIREIISSKDDVVFERANFKEFGASSLNYEIVYFINSSDYNCYIKKQEEINLSILEKFQKERIEFAFPTQTIYVAKN